MFDKKAYMKKYYQEHKEKILQTANKWNKEHPEYRKKYFQEHRQQNYDQVDRWRKSNPKRFSELCQISRKKRVEKLRAEGCTNAWCVVGKGHQPKYGSDKE